MAQRKEVFLSKVLQKLYPAVPKLQTEPNATPTESLPKKSIVKRTIQETPSTGNASSPAKRIYTVLPPPADYKTDEDKSVSHSELENLNTAEDPAEKSGHESSDDTDQSKEPGEEKRRRRKRKKRKAHVTDLNQTAVNEGQECLSKNKKRKLKKKRRKEKLLSMGLVPRAAAVEFTYQREELKQEEEEEGSCQVDKPSQDISGNP